MESKQNDEPGIRAGAYLALAMTDDRTIADEVRARLGANGIPPQDVAAYRLALSLIADECLLKAGDFRFYSLTLGEASLRVLDRFPTVGNMDLLVAEGTRHGFGVVREDVIALFRRRTGAEWIEKDAWFKIGNSEKISEWWALHRREYAEKMAAK